MFSNPDTKIYLHLPGTPKLSSSVTRLHFLHTNHYQVEAPIWSYHLLCLFLFLFFLYIQFTFFVQLDIMEMIDKQTCATVCTGDQSLYSIFKQMCPLL